MTLTAYRLARGEALAFDVDSLAEPLLVDGSDSMFKGILFSGGVVERLSAMRLWRGGVVMCDFDMTDIPADLLRHHSCHSDLYKLDGLPDFDWVCWRSLAD